MSTFAPWWPLQTDRLILRPFEPGDLGALHVIHADEAVARYLYNNPRSLDEVRALLHRKIGQAAVSGEGDGLNAAVIVRGTEQLVGEVSLLWTSQTHRQGEVGFIVHPAHQGNGYAAEAARPLLSFGFEVLGMHRIVGRTEARNASSARVLQKLGMRQEAHLIENEWVKNEWQSEFVFAILADEWAER